MTDITSGSDYKNSEVGFIPAVWQCKTVGNAYEICNENRRPLSREQRRSMEGSFPYYGPTGVLDHINEFRFTGDYALIGEDGDNFLKFSDHPMTLMAHGRFNVNNHAHVIGTGEDNIVEWFQLYFENRDITSSLTRQGAGRYKLTKAALGTLHIALPAVIEQKEIVKTISDMSSLIQALERCIAKKQMMTIAMKQHLLSGSVRLTGFTKSWNKLRLADLLAPRTQRNLDGTATDVLTCTKHYGFVRSLEYFKNQVFSRNLSGYLIIYHGDIGYPANHIEEGSIGVQEVVDRGLVSPIYVVMQPRGEVDTYFLQRQLKLEAFKQEFARVTNASVNRRGSLRWREFSQILVSVPDIDEQRAISRTLREAELDVETLHRRCIKAKAVKRGMMQELLTGRARLPSVEAAS